MFQYFRPNNSKLLLSLLLLAFWTGFGQTKYNLGDREAVQCSNQCSASGTTICAIDPEDKAIMPLSQCFLNCHKNMKPAEDQAQCFFDFCKIHAAHRQFCKEPGKGQPLESTDQCDLVKTGEAKHHDYLCVTKD